MDLFEQQYIEKIFCDESLKFKSEHNEVALELRFPPEDFGTGKWNKLIVKMTGIPSNYHVGYVVHKEAELPQLEDQLHLYFASLFDHMYYLLKQGESSQNLQTSE